MRRRHVRAILKIEQQVCPRPWSAAMFAAEIDPDAAGLRPLLVAHVGRRLAGSGGLMLAPDSAHVTNVAVRPLCGGAPVWAPACCWRWPATPSRSRHAGAHPGGAGRQRGRSAALRSASGHAGGIRKRYYEGRDDAVVPWAARRSAPPTPTGFAPSRPTSAAPRRSMGGASGRRGREPPERSGERRTGARRTAERRRAEKLGAPRFLRAAESGEQGARRTADGGERNRERSDTPSGGERRTGSAANRPSGRERRTG